MLDLLKAAAVVLLFALLFDRFYGCYQLGAAFTGFFALLGHAFPVWYQFRGGKGFLVSLSTLWVILPAAGLAATLMMVALLLLTRYMSFSTVTAMLCSPPILALAGVQAAALFFYTLSILLMTFRHRENFKRLNNGTESKFILKAQR